MFLIFFHVCDVIDQYDLIENMLKKCNLEYISLLLYLCDENSIHFENWTAEVIENKTSSNTLSLCVLYMVEPYESSLYGSCSP